MPRLAWTHEAASSLREIHDEMAISRPQTTRRTLESLINKVDALAAYPDLGSLYPYCRGRPIRILRFGDFQVAYRVEADDSILVLAVFAGALFPSRL